MDIEKASEIISGILGILFIGFLILYFTDTEILVYQKKVNPGENYIIEEHGNLGDNNQASLVCYYLYKFGIKNNVYWFSKGGYGKDKCPTFND